MKSASQKYTRFLIPAIFLLSIPVAISLVLTKPKADTAASKEVARSIQALSITTGTMAPTVPVFVKVTTPNHASMRAAITADVAELKVLEGSMVESGQDLVLLDDREASLTVEQRKAEVEEAQSQIETEMLQHENELFVIRNDQGERAKHNREQIIKRHTIRLRGLQAKKRRAESSLKLAQLDLQRTRIKAPFTGQVTGLHVSAGDRVRPGDKIIELYDKTSMELTGTIPNRYVASIQAALANETELAAHGLLNELEVHARLARLGGTVSESSAGIEAFFSIQSDPALLQLGRSVRLDLDLPTEDNAFVVPNTALYGTDMIYKVVEQRLKAINVTRLGDYDSGDAASSLLRSNEISNGDQVMITQLPNAVENLLVKVADPGK